jgi:hypothetical protein
VLPHRLNVERIEVRSLRDGDNTGQDFLRQIGGPHVVLEGRRGDGQHDGFGLELAQLVREVRPAPSLPRIIDEPALGTGLLEAGRRVHQVDRRPQCHRLQLLNGGLASILADVLSCWRNNAQDAFEGTV